MPVARKALLHLPVGGARGRLTKLIELRYLLGNGLKRQRNDIYSGAIRNQSLERP